MKGGREREKDSKLLSALELSVKSAKQAHNCEMIMEKVIKKKKNTT